MKSIRTTILVFFALFFVLTQAAMAQTIVKAEIDSTEYSIGEIVRVLVTVQNNPGLHSLYFDLEYDEGVLSLEDVRDGSLLRRILHRSELLYADNSASEGFDTTRTVVSFSMRGSNAETSRDGALVELSFRVIGSASQELAFGFASAGALDKNGKALTGLAWQDSRPFQVTIPLSQRKGFIRIKKPYENQVFYTDEASVSLILTEGNYLVRFNNNRLDDLDSDYIPVLDGRLLGHRVSLAPDMNRITAELYTPDPSGGANHIYLASDAVKVYRSDTTQFVEILDPPSHALLNTDMVKVRVRSSFDDLQVNGKTVVHRGEMEGTYKIFESQVWLSGGFNAITATAGGRDPENILYRNITSDELNDTQLIDSAASWTVDEYAGRFLEVDGGFALITGNTATMLTLIDNEIGLAGGGLPYRIRSSRETGESAGAKFKDEVQVYYRKDSTIFNFVKPMANQGFKASPHSFLTVTGEIDSLYKTAYDPATVSPVENRVSLWLTHIPRNPIEKPRILVEGRPAVIKPSDYAHSTITSKYLFKNDFPISLEGLEDGEIEIVAYKNREGSAWDDKITRVVYIDAGRLWIDLVQPNVFTSDLLDSDVKIRNFNENKPIDGDNTIIITEDGVITLESTGSELEIEKGNGVEDISGMNRIVEAADGTLYGLANTSTSSARVYQKLPGKSQWEVFFSRSGIYAYDLVSTPIGILLGVSNIPANGNSGLYLLSGTKMTNIKFPEQSLPHVQFVIFQGKRVYLYGSLYDYLYSFSLYDIEEAEGKYQVRSLTRTPLPFTGHIKQFILSEGAEIAVIRTDENEDNIHLYRRKEAGYQKTSPPSLGDTKTLSGTSLIYGPYDYNSSSYESFLILKEDHTAALQKTIEVLMRNRTTGRFFRHSVDLADWLGASASLLGVGFSDSQYTFVYNNSDSDRMQSKTGQIFFETFTTENAPSGHDIPINSNIEASGWPLFITSGGVIYLGLGYDILTDASGSGLYRFYKSSADEGEGSFNYINDDIDGLTGFSLEVDPAQAGAVDFGFSLKTRNNGSTLFSFPADHSKKSIQELIIDTRGGTFSNDGYTLSKEYNLETGRYLFHIELSKLHPDAFFNFNFTLRSVHGLASAIHAVEVFKKIPAKITSAPEINLPIKGYVYDRTVEVVLIQHEEVSVGRDGSFSHNYRVENPQNRLPVNISCYNGAGVWANMQFFLKIVESENDLWNISYVLGDSPEEKLLKPENGTFLVRTDKRELSLSGEYFGLNGAVVGYKIYSTRDGEDQRSLKSGEFITNKADSTQNSAGDSLGSDYVSGTFTTKQKIELIPNEQRLVIYVENLGGIPHEYTAEVEGQSLYPHFDYSMPADEQEISFDKDKEEVWALEGEGPPYVFTAEGIITGEILSLENFKDVLVRSFPPGLVFSNSQEEMVLPLEAGNRFSIPFTAEIGDQEVERFFTVEVIPTIPAYSYMRERIKVTVKKNFENTHFVPDFSAIHPDSWTEGQAKANGKGVPIHFTFQGRDDMPTPDKAGDPWVKAVLTINFGESITGYVDKLSETEKTYCIRPLLDGGSPQLSPSPKEIAFANEFKTGVNRVQWRFIYMEAGSQTEDTMSSSGRSGMEDFMFTLDNVREIAETTVVFKPDLEGRYYNNKSFNTEDHLPSLEIAKDAATNFIIQLNDQVVWEDTENKVTSDTVNLPTASIREGRNQLKITTKETGGSERTWNYSFLYDSALPAVHIATTRVDDSFRYLIEVSASVTEDNFRRAYLYSGSGLVNRDPRVEKLGKDTYLMTWENLRVLNLESGSIRVEVRDAAGNSGEAQADGFAARERPDTARPREINIDLPKYDGEPRTAIEDGYESRELAAHTDEELIDNPAYQKLVAPEGSAGDALGKSVSVDGDYALVGAYGDDDKGDGAGAAYIFERVSGGWEQKVKLTAIDGKPYDYFGYSVSLDGDYALVGAYGADVGGKSNAGAAYIFERGSGGWEQTEKLVVADGRADDWFGYSMSLDGDYALVGAYGDDDKGDGAGAAYIFERGAGGWEEREKLVASDGSADDWFGYSVSLDGDYALVGALYADVGGKSNAGAAYIFERGAGDWEQKKKLTATHGDSSDWFGYSVSLDGDYALVGALYADVGGKNNAGAAYIFERVSGGWEQKVKLTAIDGKPYDYFGYSVSLDGDYALVGALYADVAGKSNTGAAYIFERVSGGWIQKKKLTATDGNSSDLFGGFVSLDGDYALVGAYGTDVDGKNNAGAVYSFGLQGLSLGEGYRDFSARTKFAPQSLPKRESVRQEIINADGLLIDNPAYQKLVAPEGSAEDALGKSVSVDGDYALVGAYYADADGESNTGAAYIFERVSGGWEQKVKLTAIDGKPYDYFGYSVSLDGDYALVGAYGADVGGKNNAGAAYIFERVSGGWEQTEKLVVADGRADDWFGYSMSLDGDYALVGAYGDDDKGDGAGAAYIFERGAGGWEEREKLVASDGSADDWFGYSVSLDGDYALVGALYADVGGKNNAGAAYIFERVSGGWEQTEKLVVADGRADDWFGYSVSLDGDYALVGALYADVAGKSNTGAAYIFERVSGGWIQKKKLTATDGNSSDWFGDSVSLDGEYALVGARDADVAGKSNTGAAYIFERGAGGWIQKKKLTATDGRASDYFGSSVSLDGDYALAGAQWADVGEKRNAGATYYFNLDAFSTSPIASDKSLLDDEGMDYLVFEIPKDPLVNQLTNKNQLEGEIGFEVYGHAQNSDTLDLVKVDVIAPLTLEDGAEHYVEGLRNLYYMVDIDALKSAFRDAAESIVFSPKDWKSNLGRLQIVYDENGSLPNFTADNVSDIYVTGGPEDTFADIIVYDDAYKEKGASPDKLYDKVHPALQHSMEERTTTLSGDVDKFSLSFWLRIEDEDATDALYSNRYKRLLTFRDKSDKDMYHLGYKGTSLELIEETPGTPPQALIGGDTLPLTPGRDAWNLITLRIDPAVEGNGAKGVLVIDVYDSAERNPPQHSQQIDRAKLEKILESGATFYFGADTTVDAETKNTGFYSLANPFYIKRWLSDAEIARIGGLRDALTGSGEFYGFDASRDYGDGANELRLVNKEGQDHYAPNQNYLYYYSGGGSLKASAARPNFLARKDTGAGKGRVIFRDADSTVSYNVNVTDEAESFIIKKSTGTKGWYHFGDKAGSYGLGQNRWYSVSGTVMSSSDGDNWLVMEINGKTQRWLLQTGGFHFVFDNRDLLIPDSVKLYVETMGSVELSNDMILNEGSGRLPDAGGLDRSAASTTFPFDLSGTVSLWYKPLSPNFEGTLNQDVVLFDSEYLKIGARMPSDPGEDEALFYAEIKDRDTVWKTLATDVRVSSDWQHVQLSYDWHLRAWYFYVNGRVAAFYEGENRHVRFGSLEGNYPEEDNVRIGCDLAERVYAEGYIDGVVISKHYFLPWYSDYSPAALSYSPDSSGDKLSLDYANYNFSQDDKDNIEDSLRFSAVFPDGSYRHGLARNGIDLSDWPPGHYRIDASFTVKGYEYGDSVTILHTSKPRFTLRDKTPLVFSGESTDIQFAFKYDSSYRLDDQNLNYAGAAVKIDYNGKSSTAYLVQDFLAQDSTRWLLGSPDSADWQELTPDNAGWLTVSFPVIDPTENIVCSYEYFYFKDSFDNAAPTVIDDEEETIPLAELTEPELVSFGEDESGLALHYMIKVEISGEGGNTNSQLEEILEDIRVSYIMTSTDSDLNAADEEGGFTAEGDRRPSLINGKLVSHLYFDDILQTDYGNYKCDLQLQYREKSYSSKMVENIRWQRPHSSDTFAQQIDSLEIKDFSLLSMDKEKDTARFHLEYIWNGYSEVEYKLVVQSSDGKGIYEKDNKLQSGSSPKYFTLKDVVIPEGDFTASITLKLRDITRTASLELSNRSNAPQIILTNSPNSLISYNDVLFTWKGYKDNEYRRNIEYAYDFDGRGESSWNSEWRSVRFYNLEEGYHTFSVKARSNGVESVPSKVTFFVDIAKPQFRSDLINIERVTGGDGILYEVNIFGEAGAVTDISLQTLEVDTGQDVTIKDDGSFEIRGIPITVDGMNFIRLTATDRVGNYTDHQLSVENTLTTILFPENGELVRFAPMVIVGRIDESIHAGVEIYVKDPFSPRNGDGSYTGWKKARINADRTFFVEDVFVNPGTRDQAVGTPLTMVSVFGPNRVFTREVVFHAKEVLLPIELSLSRHFAEGENAETQVQIECRAHVEGISSWSIDFDGDGVYDAIDTLANPSAAEAQTHSWNHTYSSIGLVRPRVRVISTDGSFFSVSDTLIIHEKIREASHKMITDPIAFSSVRREDKSRRVFVLKGRDPDYAVEVYDIEPHASFFSHRQFTINLRAILNHLDSETLNPISIRALNENQLLIACDNGSGTTLYQLVQNEHGNYEKVRSRELSGLLGDLSFDEGSLYVSYENFNYITRIPLTDGLMDNVKHEDKVLPVYNTAALGSNSALARDAMGLLVADYYNQRILRFTNNLTMQEQFGSFGVGEKEFLSPSMIRSFQNRIFVFDERRGDIQVFDQGYTPITTLEYRAEADYHNYLGNDFFLDLADIDIMTREEGNQLYYYALLLSKSNGKLALLRLPQWEELRARARNNKIVFLQDGEVYTAKPGGSDLRKLLTTDSLPRIEGALDYPSLSPDGKRLIFTSRLNLYIGRPEELLPLGEPYDYNQIYLYNIEDRSLERLSLGEIQGYAIERPVFNSNGDTLILGAKQGGQRWQIYTLHLKSGRITRLFSTDENARFPFYSPNDDYIVFTTDYDGDEDIVIVDVKNPETRIELTSNYTRDSLPVWISTYPHEVNKLTGIESKIAFVSEHQDFQKAIYYTYIQHIPGGGVNVVNSLGKNVGDDPDSAALRVTPADSEGDYPSFTGDGTTVIYEYFDGSNQRLRKHDKTNEPEPIGEMPLPSNAVRPSGMKNMINNFAAVNVNGNEMKLTWDPYTESDIFYVVEVAEDNVGAVPREMKVLSQTGTTVRGLQMGQAYLVRAYIEENGEEVATSRYQTLEIPVVAARPNHSVDSENPYLVRLSAWKPEQLGAEQDWYFSWIIDNQEILVQKSQSYSYEFSTSGRKTIQLKAYTNNHSNVAISEPFFVDIVSDIEPVIESHIAEDGSYVELSCENSLGHNIDFANASWVISGPGGNAVSLSGPRVIPQLDGFRHKINVTLTLSRTPVGAQTVTDSIVRTKVIDLDFQKLLPVISVETHEKNDLLLKFSGQDSLGNIDWYRAGWIIYADNQILHQVSGVSTFEYLFPEQNKETVYTVSLNVPDRSNGITETISRQISVEAAPIKPVIDYQIITLKEGDNTVGQKIIFDATGSTGNGIDFSQARWSMAGAGDYGEQAMQIGPVATYNLLGIERGTVVEVALTLMRRGGTDPVTATQLISVAEGQTPEAEVVVNTTIEESNTGKVLILDVLKSTGPNIDWERTNWLIDDKYVRNGPVVRYDVQASAAGEVITYTCTLYRHGAKPQVITDQVEMGVAVISPRISYSRISPVQPNVVKLSVLESSGANIDWERTQWHIYDGSQEVVLKNGSVITHAFAMDSDKMGYPVMVKMYFRGDPRPFVGYKSIDVEGSELTPVITYKADKENPEIITFSAEDSVGGGIDWAQTKWTFFNSAETQYGPVVTHNFPSESTDRSYTVVVTLYRRLSNGEVESVSGRREIRIGANEIVPRILARADGDYLVLSAEQSEGSGLLLDRAQWTFPGKGDSVSGSSSRSSGVTSSHTFGVEVSKTVDILFGGGFRITGRYSYSDVTNTGTTDTDSYSTQNTHHGAICRRYIGGSERNVIATLFVYRVTAEGGTEGKSITVTINLDEARNSPVGITIGGK